MDITELLRESWGQLSAGALLGLLILSIIRGVLVPRTVLDGWTQLWEARLAAKAADVKAWRELAESERIRADRSEDQNRKLMEIGETTLRVLQALPGRDSGGDRT